MNQIKIGTISLSRSCYRNILVTAIIVLSFLIILAFVCKSDQVQSGARRLLRHRTLKLRFADRNSLLKRKCGIFAPETEVQPSRHFYMKKPDFSFCMIPKVASTSFSRFIVSAHQKIKRGKGMRNLGYANGNFSASVSNSTYKVMIVRHPMDRLLSAYLYIFVDQVVNDESKSNMYSNLTRLLLSNYRDDADFSPNEDLLTFPEFVRYVVNGTKENLNGRWQAVDGQNETYWIVDPNLNSHWSHYHVLCSPCNEKTFPTAVLKFGEDVDEEAEYVFRESGVFDYFRDNGVKETDLKVNKLNAGKEGKSEVLRRKYYPQLTKSQVRDLYEKYRIDFELFGYDPQPFLDLAL